MNNFQLLCNMSKTLKVLQFVWALLEESLDLHFPLAADFHELSVRELVRNRLLALMVFINGCLLGAHAT